MKADTVYWLPPKEPQENWFCLDENVGQEKIYFIASRWPSLDLENLFSQLKNTSSDEEKDELKRKLLKRIESKNQLQRDEIKGVFYQVILFEHVE